MTPLPTPEERRGILATFARLQAEHRDMLAMLHRLLRSPVFKEHFPFNAKDIRELVTRIEAGQ